MIDIMEATMEQAQAYLLIFFKLGPSPFSINFQCNKIPFDIKIFVHTCGTHSHSLMEHTHYDYR